MLNKMKSRFLLGNISKYYVVFLMLLSTVFSQNSSITIHGTGDPATSAHITVTTGAYKCPGTPGEYIVEAGASLKTWDPSAICGADTSGSGDITLPVELTEFTAQQIGSSVSLKWTTESETENLGFILDRKEIAADWINIATYQNNPELEGYGSTTSSHDYKYTDDTVESEKTYLYRLSDVSYEGIVEISAELEISIYAENLLTQPTEFALHPAYPNPFNPTTTIHYGIPDSRNVTIMIYDMMGQKVVTLFSGTQQAGWYQITWNGLINDGEMAPAGTYLYKLIADDEVRASKITFIK